MRIAIVSINYRPELTGIGVYTAGLAEHMAQDGHEVEVLTGFPYYPAWRKAGPDEWIWRRLERVTGVVVKRSYLYVPSRPRLLTRVLHEFSFVLSASVRYLISKPVDCTLIVSPPMFTGVPIAILARLRGSRTVFHVQDLQPDAAIELGMLPRGPIADVLLRLERWTYRLCDRVSTISEGMRRRIVGKGVPAEKVILFRNWANDDRVRPMARETALRREWGLEGKFVVLYAGNLGIKQGLGSLLESARLLTDIAELRIVIVGDGGERADLENRARNMGLGNVLFRPLQPEERLSELLATADVSVMPQKAGVTDIVLPSKLGNLLCSARPLVVAAAEGSELARIVAEANCGLVVGQENSSEIALAVRELYGDPALRDALGSNGREYMRTHLGHRAVLDSFLADLYAINPKWDVGRDLALERFP
ncbi:MAG: WcaI family glycosyltransferase [Rhodocyclaceae bacterium]